MKKIFLTLFFVVGCFSIGHSQEDSYTKTLKTFFELNGTRGSYTAVIDQMKQMYISQGMGGSDQVNKLFDEMKSSSVDDLIEMLVPVYKKHLTEADLKELIKFYQSPIGKKLAESTPDITAESMQVGQQWGMQLAQKMQQKLQE